MPEPEPALEPVFAFEPEFVPWLEPKLEAVTGPTATLETELSSVCVTIAVEVTTACDVNVTLPLVAVTIEVESTAEVIIRVERRLEPMAEGNGPLLDGAKVTVAYEVSTVGEGMRTEVVTVLPAEKIVVGTVAVLRTVT